MKDTNRIKTAFKNYLNAIQELRNLGIYQNKRDFTSQLGEWLVETLFEGKRAINGNQKYWDIETKSDKIQVKTHSKANTNKTRWSSIKYDEHADVDFVVIVVFSQEYQLKEIYRIPWSNCLELINKDKNILNWDSISSNHKIDLKTINNHEILSFFSNPQ